MRELPIITASAIRLISMVVNGVFACPGRTQRNTKDMTRSAEDADVADETDVQRTPADHARLRESAMPPDGRQRTSSYRNGLGRFMTERTRP
jgi:hypothetical protein